MPDPRDPDYPYRFGGPILPDYGPQPGQLPDQHAGYGVSGMPYSGRTPEPAPLPREPISTGQAVLIGIAVALIALVVVTFVVVGAR